MLDRDWNGSFFGECCNCPTVTSALKQPKRIDRMLFIAPQPLQAALLHPLPLSLLPSIHACTCLQNFQGESWLGWAPSRVRRVAPARFAGNVSHPRSNPSPFNLPIHSIIIIVVVILRACCRIKFCIFADVICDFSAAVAPPQHFKVGKHS